MLELGDKINIGLTSGLVGAAIAAAVVGWHNLKILRKQFKLNTFLSLLSELGEEHSRQNRRLIFQHLPNSNKVTNIKEGIIRDNPDVQIYRDALEETIASLDRVAFFLLKGDPSLKDDAPVWIWTITSQMWERTEWYVSHRKKSHKGYGKYFEELAEEARKRGFNEEREQTQNSNDGEGGH
ncbi:MAG: hypothetical protein FJ025_04470 [Chloroflexi bacterium]|nr:hypothetical protein [Chloroflexota bacterium]